MENFFALFARNKSSENKAALIKLSTVIFIEQGEEKVCLFYMETDRITRQIVKILMLKSSPE